MVCEWAETTLGAILTLQRAYQRWPMVSIHWLLGLHRVRPDKQQAAITKGSNIHNCYTGKGLRLQLVFDMVAILVAIIEVE